MAKKRKKDKKEEEEYEFIPPEFDEKEFLKKEIKDTKVSLTTIAIAVIFGIVAGGIAEISRSLVAPALLIGFGGAISLKYIYQILKIDVSHFQKKNWLGAVGSFFFTFLAVTVLLINVPFADFANPTVDKVIVWINDGSELRAVHYDSETSRWVYTPADNDDTWTPVIHSGDAVNITALVTDNGKLSVVEIAVVPAIATYLPMTKDQDGRYNYSLTGDMLSGQGLSFSIRAVDGSGNSVLFSPSQTIPFA
jgi:hypothetical protein